MHQNQPLTNVDDAMSFVNRCVFQPGATFKSYRATFMDDDMFVVILHVDVHDSDDWPDYRTMRDERFTETVALRLSDVPTEDHLARAMIDLWRAYLDATWEHEAREFFRVDGEHAIFHPHHIGDEPDKGYNVGEARWMASSRPRSLVRQ